MSAYARSEMEAMKNRIVALELAYRNLSNEVKAIDEATSITVDSIDENFDMLDAKIRKLDKQINTSFATSGSTATDNRAPTYYWSETTTTMSQPCNCCECTADEFEEDEDDCECDTCTEDCELAGCREDYEVDLTLKEDEIEVLTDVIAAALTKNGKYYGNTKASNILKRIYRQLDA